MAARVRLEKIAAARAELARRYRDEPEAVAQFQTRMGNLARAAKRERDRVAHLVLGEARPTEKVLQGKRSGRRKPVKRNVPVRLAPGIEEAVSLREHWAHKNVGTPETHEHAASTHQGALAQLHANGTIDSEQLEWAAQIANVHRSIESDVAVAIASLEARVDQSARAPAVAERIHRVRMHAAYGIWRKMLPMPKRLVLDMIVGDAIGYSVAATRYRVHKRKARRLLIEAVQRWPLCVAHAFSAVDQADVDAMNMARRPYGRSTSIVPPALRYEHARQAEAGREKTDEPYLLPPLDPVFLDDRGLLKEWKEIATIIRERVFGDADAEAA